MNFLIQKINKRITHDFSFTLLESIRYQKWIQNNPNAINVKYLDYIKNSDDKLWNFKPFHRNYIPVGSINFVLVWMNYFNIQLPKPKNVPEELFSYCHRHIFNGNQDDLKGHGKSFVKTNDSFKGFCEIVNDDYQLQAGNYQISELIDIESEWRCFVYNGKLVGLQNYLGTFDMFPHIENIKSMITAYRSAPIAYTLDIGIHNERVFPIEVHDFFSIGLYGFSDHNILPYMFYRWFKEYLNNLK